MKSNLSLLPSRRRYFQGRKSPWDTPNFIDILKATDSLPMTNDCQQCIAGWNRTAQGNCENCAEVCPGFCSKLCHVQVKPKFVAKELTIRPPVKSRDPDRIIPRVIHQTWFEELTPDKYEYLSNYTESFRSSGWDYKFYTDKDAANFLSTHFPPEFREVFDTLNAGAFKADFFRYCVLFIHGGVYSDVDIRLDSDLDISVPEDVGFMVAFDRPGRNAGVGMCVWQGFIASAPGHPILADAIQTVVNQVRNKFTSLDIDERFCPNPVISILHRADLLFMTGPCLLGASINRALGRPGQMQFDPGEIVSSSFQPPVPVPGRTVILDQERRGVTGLVLRLDDLKTTVVALDVFVGNDKRRNSKQSYHAGRGGGKFYGEHTVYRDQEKANEDIRISVA